MNRRRINRKNVAKHLMKYQLDLVGRNFNDTNDNNWENWTITEKEYNKFKIYSIRTLKKVFKFNASKAIITFDWFYNHFGLKIDNKNN
tara:strand:+ start:2153 stop:2416 length:264 start_codon:yes stop_codon:yes gene_type:complete